MLCRTVLLVALAGHLCHALPTGAPEQACDNFTPDHRGAVAQTTEAPYALEVSSDTVGQGSTVSVTLKSTQSNAPFAGFLIKAVSLTGTQPLGSFSSTEKHVQFRDCGSSEKSAVTHTSKDNKTQVTVTWTAPTNFNDEVLFVATVVANFTTFWQNIKSSAVQVSASTGSSFNTTSTPMQNAVSKESALYAGCGQTKGCYGGPTGGCIGSKNCDFLVTYRKDGENVIFQLMGKTNGYVALGFSTDNKMGEDSVTQCVVEKGLNGVQAAQSYNPSRSNKPLDNPDEGLQVNATASFFVDGRVMCEFTRVGQQNVEGKQFNLINDKYYLLIAVGSANSKTEIKPHRTSPRDMWVSGSAIKVTETQVLGSGASTRYLIAIHVLLLLSSLCFVYSNSMF